MQGILAPVQFLVFLVSLVLVARFLLTGDGGAAATWSVVIKTLVLYTIMVTGAIWERVVFGQYLFASAFFWEDVFSMLVLALHTLYLACVAFGWLGLEGQMYVALAAYAAYVINAIQFLVKFKMARKQAPVPGVHSQQHPGSTAEKTPVSESGVNEARINKPGVTGQLGTAQ